MTILASAPGIVVIPMPYVYGAVAAIVVLVAAFMFFNKKKTAKEAAAPEAPAAVPVAAHAPAPAVAAAPAATLAPGSAGKLKLYDTPPKTAAMLMAIVADKMGKPLNELRFISIKEVK